MTTLFWSLLGVVVYVYAGYPVLLALLRLVRGGRPPQTAPIEPPVTVIISAFNEEAVIADKLRNCLALQYPRERLQTIVVSDASEDRTDEIVRRFSGDGVELLRMPGRCGKTVGLNAAVERARGEIVIFSDANAMYYADAVPMLVRNFADKSVGAVVGESTYVGAEVESERSEGLYWRYESAIKRLETAIGSVVGGDGAIYAIRRALYVPMAADALSDFVNPLQIVAGGDRCVYEPAARSYERAGDDFQKEFRRKVRIVNRGWRATIALRRLLNPFRYHLFAFELFSHKLLRWILPAFMAALLVVNLLIVDRGAIYAVALISQLSFYGLAALGHALRQRPSMPPLLSVPYFFCLVNIASVIGIRDAIRGQTYTTWTTARAKGP